MPFATILLIATLLQTSADLKALDGEWVYVEDLTPNRPLEQLGPPMTAKFSFRIEENAVILVVGHGSGHQNVRVPLDGSPTEIQGPESTARYTGTWQDGTYAYKTEFLTPNSPQPPRAIYKTFKPAPEGLIVTVKPTADAPGSVALYRHPQDIPLATPAKAVITDLDWLSGNWVGTRGTAGTTTIEERWGPPLGGSMLAVNRTVSRGRLAAFEYLRIVERDGGLVYIAQPGGSAPTEFILTEHAPNRAVFENPRHDYPKKIVYQRSGDALTATIGFLKGGSPRPYEFKREGTSEVTNQAN